MAKKKKKPAKKGLKKALDKIGNKLKKVGSNIKFAPLIPFVPMMKLMLKKKKVSHGKSIEQIAEAFYKTFVKKNFDGKELNFDSYESYNVIPPAIVASVIQGVLAFIKDLISKKKELEKKEADGQPLTPEEKDIIDAGKAAEGGAEALSNAADDVLDEKGFGDFAPYLIGILLVVGLVIIIKK